MLLSTCVSALGETTVEFFQQKMEEAPQRAYAEAIAKFQEENPDLVIQLNTVPDAGTVLQQRISTGDIPPIFTDYPTQMQFKTKVANGYIECLEGQEWLERVNPGMLALSANTDKAYALPLFQYNFKTEYSFNYTMAFTAYLLSLVPVLVMYCFCQKYIISGLTAGAVKS